MPFTSHSEDCPIEASLPVSRFLSGIFPNVSLDIVTGSSTRRDRDRWMEVREQLLHFLAAREEERAWSLGSGSGEIAH